MPKKSCQTLCLVAMAKHVCVVVYGYHRRCCRRCKLLCVNVVRCWYSRCCQFMMNVLLQCSVATGTRADCFYSHPEKTELKDTICRFDLKCTFQSKTYSLSYSPHQSNTRNIFTLKQTKEAEFCTLIKSGS